MKDSNVPIVKIPSASRKVSDSEIRKILKKRYEKLPFIKRQIKIWANASAMCDWIFVINGKSYYYGEILRKNLHNLTDSEILRILGYNTAIKKMGFDKERRNFVNIVIQPKKIDTKKISL